MKHKLKIFLTFFFNPIAEKLGYQRQLIGNNNPNDKNSLLKTFFNVSISMGFIPKHIIDIGANHGTWTRETIKYFPDAHYTMLEPQHWLRESFQDLMDLNPRIDFHAVGAGNKIGTFEFTIVDRDDSCNFRYTKEEAKERGYEQIEVPIITLDDLILSQINKPFPDLVKIDAEGLDIQVLEGASSLMGKTEVFMVEAAVGCKEMTNSLFKIVNYMNEKGYILFDITDLNRPFSIEILWLTELVFIKKNGVLDRYKVEL